MVCSVLIHALRAVSPHVHILFYADDLLLYIPLPAPAQRASSCPPYSSIFDSLAFLWGYK